MKLEIPDRKFCGYIFDCDGTIADTMPLHYRAWSRMVEGYGGHFPRSLFYELGGMPSALIVELLNARYGLAMEIGEAIFLKEKYFDELISEVVPIDPVLEIAKRLFGTAPLAIASGGYRKQVEMTLNILEIAHLFDAVICAEDYKEGKPSPEPFLEAARQISIPPTDCLVFEDSMLGIEAAKAANMAYVLVPAIKPGET